MKERNGFTLIEVLVAIAILGIGLGVIMQLFSGGLRSAKISEDYTKATWYGRAKMEEVLTAKDLAEGVEEGSFDDQFSWRTEVKVENLSVGQQRDVELRLPVDLYRINVKVIWKAGTGERSLELESLRAFKAKEATTGTT